MALAHDYQDVQYHRCTHDTHDVRLCPAVLWAPDTVQTVTWVGWSEVDRVTMVEAVTRVTQIGLDQVVMEIFNVHRCICSISRAAGAVFVQPVATIGTKLA